MKKCSVCKEYKPLNDFHKSSTQKDKKHSYCKDCMNFYVYIRLEKKKIEKEQNK